MKLKIYTHIIFIKKSTIEMLKSSKMFFIDILNYIFIANII